MRQQIAGALHDQVECLFKQHTLRNCRADMFKCIATERRVGCSNHVALFFPSCLNAFEGFFCRMHSMKDTTNGRRTPRPLSNQRAHVWMMIPHITCSEYLILCSEEGVSVAAIILYRVPCKLL